MKIEYNNGVTIVHAFSDLVVTTENNELLYMSIKGYDTAIQAIKAACLSQKYKQFWLYPTPDCPNILNGKRNQLMKVIGTFRAFLAKEDDLTHAEIMRDICLEQNSIQNSVILAWDGDLVSAFLKKLKSNYPYPFLDEWAPYIFERLAKLRELENCCVYSTSEPNLKAVRILADEERIEAIVKSGFEKGYLDIPEGEAGEGSLDSCTDVTSYLKNYSRALAQKLSLIFVPLHRPGDPVNPKIKELKRTPFRAQADVINGLHKALKEKNSAMVIAEMGTGKTIISIAVAHLLQYAMEIKAMNVLVMCPGHLKAKWKREIEETVPKAAVYFIDSYLDVFRVRDVLSTEADHPRYFIISKDTAKLSYFKRRAVRWSNRRQGWVCPDCGAIQMVEKGSKNEKESYPLSYEEFEQETAKTSKCCVCGTKLWTADNQMVRRVAPTDLIKKYLKGKFDLFIADELHQYKGCSAQGFAFGTLMQAAKKTLGLTGTLLGGYASNVFRILFRMNPQAFFARGMNFYSEAYFISQYGVLERTYKESDKGAVRNRASNGFKQIGVRERPGISPKVFGEFLLDRAVFLRLSDISDQLPSYKETVELIEMDPELQYAYDEMAGVLRDYLNRNGSWGSNGLGVYLNNLLSYPDKPFDNPEILVPGTDEVLFKPVQLDPTVLYAKEARLIELIKQNKREGRRCLVYATYTGKKDVSPRLKDILTREGIKAIILRSSVKPEKREEWLADKVYKGYDVVICNPTLIETGLDCIDFPTIIFYQTGYNLFTLRQASRRSYRPGQKKDVHVYFLVYADTLQEAAIRLMGAKLEASLSIEGDFSEEGLRMMGSGFGQDVGTALAKALVHGLDGVDSAEEIWGRMGYGPIAYQEETQEAKSTSDTPVVGGPASPGLIKIIEIKVKKRNMQHEVVQLGWDFDSLGGLGA